jgi:1,5-anhydro-D-fructose reductase (1,5-anhydro-D-mannitol-forming)
MRRDDVFVGSIPSDFAIESAAMGESRALGWGLVGCGDIAAKRVAAALRDTAGSALVAVARARAELAEAFAREHRARRAHASWRDLVRDPEVDAVYVATPVRLHPEQAVAAAEAGKHVLCEKPMALDVAGCTRILDACRAHGVRLGVAYYRHHYPIVARLRAILASGEVGAPVLASVQAFERFDPGPDHPRAWLLRRKESGGGPMMDFGCHRIEVLLHLLGPVARVDGFPVNVRLRGREVEDTCLARLGFAGGAEAVLAVTHAARESRDSIEVFASEGSLHVPVLNQGRLRVVTAEGTREEDHPPPANLHQPLVEDFVRAVREGREPAVTGEIGREVSRVLDAIYGR